MKKKDKILDKKRETSPEPVVQNELALAPSAPSQAHAEKPLPSPQSRRRQRLELLFKGFFAFALLCLFSFIYIFVKFSGELPDYQQLAEYRPPITSRFYAGDGTLLTEYATERRVFVELKDMPQNLVNAFISAEDKNFWRHGGIDFSGLTRALYSNIKYFLIGGSRGGGSTITQQVAKNFFLTSERKISRKLKEAILAMRMERTFTKRHILTLYMNQIFLGNRSFGVAAAALNYFGKSLNELTLSESAFLAALPKAPSAYNPHNSYERALARRNWVLERMHENGFITEEVMLAAQAEDIVILDTISTPYQRYALYFSEEVRKTLAGLYGEDQLYGGGLAVRTTVNPTYQEVATNVFRRALLAFDRRRGLRNAEYNIGEVGDGWQRKLRAAPVVSGMEEEGWRKALILDVKPETARFGLLNGETAELKFPTFGWTHYAVKDSVASLGSLRQVLKAGDVVFVQKDGANWLLRQPPEVNGGMVAMDPNTGRVFALVGGFSYSRSKFNRATQAFRQPGSTIKPFVYLSALERGYAPSTVILDAPIVMEQAGGELWRPENYDNIFEGEITFRRALEKSKNNPTVRIVISIGLGAFLDTAVKFGVYKSVKSANLAMALGAGDTHLLDLTAAFAQLFNGGKSLTPIFIDRVQDRDGHTIFRTDRRECFGCANVAWDDGLMPPEIPDEREQLADPVAVYQIVHLMEGVVQFGSGWLARIPGHTIAGKTGTSNDQKDVWFIGATPDLVVGVFLGYDQPRSLGNTTAGGTLAAPVFREFMEQVLKGKKDMAFRVPDGITFVRVNRHTGRRATASDPGGDIVIEAFREGTEGIVDTPSFMRGGDGSSSSAANFDGVY